MRFADLLTRAVDRLLFGPRAEPPRQWTPQRYALLVREHAVVDTSGSEQRDPVGRSAVLDRVFPEDGAA